MTYNRKMPKQVEPSEATRKALGSARTEKQRVAASQMEAGMASGLKKELRIKHVGRSANKKALR
jgi:hypothetical protein